MTPEERAACSRFFASVLRAQAAQLDLDAAMIECGQSMQRLADSFNEGITREFEAHPDLAYLDAQLSGYYDTP